MNIISRQPKKITWETIEQDQAVYMSRSRVPWGWIMMTCDDAYIMRSDGYTYTPEAGYQWRTSITFIFDPFHWWKPIVKDGKKA